MNEKILYFDEINFHSLLVDILRNLWVVALICISAVLCFTGWQKYSYTPQYTSSATFMVSARDSTNVYNSLTTTQSMASVFAEVFQSKVLREKIQESMDGETFTGVITPQTIPQTNLLIVTVTSPKPEIAFKAMTAITENYNTISDYIFANAQLEVIKDPVVPTAPSNPLNTRSRRTLVLLLSAAVGLAAIVALSVLRDTVQTPKAAKRKLDGRVLRVIHHEEKNKTLRSKYLRKKAAPLVTNPLINKGFIEDNMSLSSAMEYHMRKREEKVILITSAGENEGKSTVATNLALTLAARNKRVLLLDCDFRKPSLHKILETPVPKDSSLSTFLTGDSMDPASFIQKLDKYGFCLGASHPGIKSIHNLINSPRLSYCIAWARDAFDYIILDTPPMLAAADTEALARLADTAVMVVRADFMKTVAINDCLEALRQSVPDMAGIVLNNYHKNLV